MPPHYERIALLIALVAIAGVGLLLLNNASAGGFVIGSSIGSSTVISNSASAGLYSYCYDSDNGIKPGEPGVTVLLVSPQPLPSGVGAFFAGVSGLGVGTGVNSSAYLFPPNSSNSNPNNPFTNGFVFMIGNVSLFIYTDVGSGNAGNFTPGEPTNNNGVSRAILNEKYCITSTYTGSNGQTLTSVAVQNRFFAGNNLGRDLVDTPYAIFDNLSADYLK
ncbi:MAG: hypothetical protein IPJ89_04070 [Candidatus Iainarchaeum archaeon]|uniref:Uncharacterized protein n=1 Tax=Candidatus Iainarchaeum sp. TaxID=3101447 RepID=A0A7T9DJC4_9ARCH|nr:MAG: hypothetical protein IPJ89_04070 [Candidatus Diapherotrites archaeon]